MKKMKIHTGDTVRVIAGKNRFSIIAGTDGAADKKVPLEAKVLRTFPKDDLVLVEGVNIVTKHVKKQGSTPGQIIKFEKPVHVSNVMLVCPHTKQPTRIGIKHGTKTERISKKANKAI